MGIKTSPYQNGDPQTNMGIVQSLTHTNMGFIPIWGPTELIPKLERHSKWGPHIGMGIPILVWVGICVCVCTCSPVSGGSVSITRYQSLNLTPDDIPSIPWARCTTPPDPRGGLARRVSNLYVYLGWDSVASAGRQIHNLETRPIKSSSQRPLRGLF
jgi:hypothetical protein